MFSQNKCFPWKEREWVPIPRNPSIFWIWNDNNIPILAIWIPACNTWTVVSTADWTSGKWQIAATACKYKKTHHYSQSQCSGKCSFHLLLTAADRPLEILWHFSNKTLYDNRTTSSNIIHFFQTLQDSWIFWEGWLQHLE